MMFLTGINYCIAFEEAAKPGGFPFHSLDEPPHSQLHFSSFFRKTEENSARLPQNTKKTSILMKFLLTHKREMGVETSFFCMAKKFHNRILCEWKLY